MRSLRQHLVLSYLLIIALGVGGAGAATWIVVERVYLSTQAANLLAQAEAVAADLADQPPPPPLDQPYSQFSNAMPGFHTHVVPNQSAPLLNIAQPADLPIYYAASAPSADVAGRAALDLAEASPPDDVDPAPDGFPTLFERSEIQAAQQGRPSTAIRQVAAAGNRRVLYAAAPVRSADGVISSLVYIATPLPVSGWAALDTRTRWLLGAILVGLVGLAGAVGWALAANLARPLSRLSAAASAVAAGDLGHSVPEQARLRELHRLGQAFNAMTSSLHQADQAKKAFVADVSHELRTPLTIIKGTVETLQDGAVDDLEVREAFLQSLAGETERLIRLVNDLLILNRAGAGALQLDLEPTDLAALARERAGRFAGLAASQGAHVLVESAESSLWVTADAHRLAQVLDNLLHNAIRHAPQGRIRVSLGADGGWVRCAVADSGAGIPARHLPHIFERFYRVDGSRNRASGGSGLGLAIAQALVQAHGGRIAVASIEGQGATFTFSLPRAAD